MMRRGFMLAALLMGVGWISACYQSNEFEEMRAAMHQKATALAHRIDWIEQEVDEVETLAQENTAYEGIVAVLREQIVLYRTGIDDIRGRIDVLVEADEMNIDRRNLGDSEVISISNDLKDLTKLYFFDRADADAVLRAARTPEGLEPHQIETWERNCRIQLDELKRLVPAS